MDCPKCSQENKEGAKFCSNCGLSLPADVVAPFMGPKEGSSPSFPKLGQKSIGAGLGTALVASLCCVVPLIALTLGVGGASTLLILGEFRPYFIGTSLVFLVFAIGIVLRRNERDECCSLEEKRRNRLLLPLYVLGSYLVIFSLVTYFITPRLYGGLNSEVNIREADQTSSSRNISETNPANYKKLNLNIQGFTCPSCPAGVKSVLLRREGIIEADIEATGKSKIIYDEKKISQNEILKAIRQLGYRPVLK